MSLLTSRRLAPLLVTQTLGAINDNLFKNALVVLILFQAAQAAGPALVALAGGVFILPYVAAVRHRRADRRPVREVAHHPARQGGRGGADGAGGGRVPARQHAAAVRRAVRPRGAGDVLQPAEIRHPAQPPRRARAGGRQRAGRGRHLPRHPGRHHRRQRAVRAGPRAADRLGRRAGGGRRRRREAALVPRAPSSAPDLRIGWNLARETGALLAHGAGQPAGVAVPAGAELVLGDRRHAAGRTADAGARRPRRRRARVHADAGVLLGGRGRRVGAVLAAAARRGVGAAGAVRGARAVAVPVGFRPRVAAMRRRCRRWPPCCTASPAGACWSTCCCWRPAADCTRCRCTPSSRNARRPPTWRAWSRPTTW